MTRHRPLAGDFLVFHSNGIAAKAIQYGTRSRWNHAAVYVGNGRIIEAQPHGVVESPLDSHDVDVASHVPLTSWQRRKIAAAARDLVGTPYGWLDILALAGVNLGLRWQWLVNRAKRDDRIVCSQLVSLCYERAGVPLAPDWWAVTPGDLADLILEED